MCEGERVRGGKCSATHSLKLQKNALGREGRDLRARLVRDGDQDVPPSDATARDVMLSDSIADATSSIFGSKNMRIRRSGEIVNIWGHGTAQ